MIKPSQLKAARAMLGLSQAELGGLASISTPRVYALESGSDCLMSTATAIRNALESKGAIFNSDGSVNVREKDDPFITLSGAHPGDGTLRATPERVAIARQIIAAGKRGRT